MLRYNPESKLYQAVIGECEGLEHRGNYLGNGHHLAQRLVQLVLPVLAAAEEAERARCIRDIEATSGHTLGAGSELRQLSAKEMQEQCVATIQERAAREDPRW